MGTQAENEKFTYTLGPWTFETLMDRPRDIEIFSGICLVATVNSENVDRQEVVFNDARLIAAAPEMYEALKALQEWSWGTSFGIREAGIWKEVDRVLALIGEGRR